MRSGLSPLPPRPAAVALASGMAGVGARSSPGRLREGARAGTSPAGPEGASSEILRAGQGRVVFGLCLGVCGSGILLFFVRVTQRASSQVPNQYLNSREIKGVH